MRLLILGAGYSGKSIARICGEDFDEVVHEAGWVGGGGDGCGAGEGEDWGEDEEGDEPGE